MLRGDRQLRVQLYQYIDGCVFAVGLWLAWLIRDYVGHLGIRKVPPLGPFEAGYFWLFLVVIPMTPMVLEGQGFYERPFFTPVREMAWQLVRSCTISALSLVLIEFMLRRQEARSVFVLFG